MATPQDLKNANGMEEKLQAGWKKIKPRFDTFVVDINDAIKSQDSAELDVVMTGIDPLRKLMDASMSSIQGATALYAPMSKDAPFMQAHSKEIIQKVKALAALKTELLADLKSLDDLEKKANIVSNSAASSDKDMRAELAALQNEVDSVVKLADDAIARSDKLYDDAQTARYQRNQKKLVDARVALIDCQGTGLELEKTNAKVVKFTKAHSNADDKVKDQLETMTNSLAFDLGPKGIGKVRQLVKDSLAFGNVLKIDPAKAAAALKITDKKDTSELDKLLNSPQVDLEKALGILAKKYKTTGRAMVAALDQKNLL